MCRGSPARTRGPTASPSASAPAWTVAPSKGGRAKSLARPGASPSNSRTGRERLCIPPGRWGAEKDRVERMEQRRHLKAKIALVGEAAVGKTSLIRRYVESQFSDAYLMTIGVKVSKKRLEIAVPGEPIAALLELAVWDVMGQPKFRELLQEAYFTGVSGIIGVADLSRRRSSGRGTSKASPRRSTRSGDSRPRSRGRTSKRCSNSSAAASSTA